jgi:serine/threonine protein kinase
VTDPTRGRAAADAPLDETLMPSAGARSGSSLPRSGEPVAEAGGNADGLSGYKLLGELGRGGMGVVYRARHVRLNRPVALKMVLAGSHAGPAELARFQAEAEAVARVPHPNIVQIYEVGEHLGRPFLALELVEGSSLQKAIAGTPQPVRPAVQLVETLARAVHAAHLRGVVHRDLKPGNVLLARQEDGGSGTLDQDAAQVAAVFGVPKVTDFGLAKRLEEESNQTHSGDILGTPSYMAPEQAAGRAADAGPGVDVYSLGAILYELLTGRPPFKGATPIETLHQVLHEDPVPPGRLRSKLPKDLERICLKCLEKDPRRRYATAAGLADDLRRHLNGEAVRARPAGPAERVWRWSRRNPVPAGLIAAITVGAAVGFAHLGRLSKSLVRDSALEAAAEQTQTMDELNRYYSRVAVHLRDKAGVKGVHDWEKGEKTMPPPATMTIELGQQITSRSETGMQVRLYSEYPFLNRKDTRPPLDRFEREALARLRSDPSKPVHSFEEQDGRPVLRYATARVMEAGCVYCHNSHKDSPKKDWKEGDLRGVLEIVRPLDRDEKRIADGLRGTVLLVSGIGATLLGLTGVLMFVGNRGRRLLSPAAEHPPPQKPDAPAAAAASTEADNEQAETQLGRMPGLDPAVDENEVALEPPPFDTDRGGAGDTLARPGKRG